jgi:ABC-type phosphate transport system substrate-binding protein
MKNKYFSVIIFAILALPIAVNAGQVVVVNPANGDALDATAISKIYLGKLKKFPSGASVVAVNQKAGSAGKVEFDKKVTKKSASQIKAYWAKLMFSGKGKPPKEVGSDSDVKSFIAGEPNGIGYIDESSVDDSVKVLLKL